MRNGPPPSVATSLPAAFVSVLAHGGAILAGLIMIPVELPKIESTPMVYIPIELITIAETTNIAPVIAEAKIEEEPVDAAEEASAGVAAPPPPEEDSVSLEPPKPEPPKPPTPPKKPEAKPAPAAPAKSFDSELDDILASVTKDAPKAARADANAKPASAATGAPRMGAGDMKRMTASVTDFIRSQLIANRCWTDHSDMADARRLRATFRVWFGRNGKFSQPYQLVNPGREPNGDLPLMTFIAHGRRALDMCNQIGWRVPEDYFKLPQPAYVDIELVPKVGAQ